MGTKIAIISDIHFGSKARQKDFYVPGGTVLINNNEKSIIDGLIERIKEHKAEYLVVAGDLTSIGSPQELKYSEMKILEIANACGILKDNIIVTLGNHDIDWGIVDLRNNHRSNDPSVRKYIKESYIKLASESSRINLINLDESFVEKGEETYTGIVEKKNFIVLVLNSGFECIKEETYGKLKNHQLSWLEEKLKHYESDDRWKIILLHHHPFSYKYQRPYRDVSTLSDGPEFLEIVGKGKGNIVIHGHRHHPNAETANKTSWANEVTYICSGSLSVNSFHRNHGEIPNAFHIIELFSDDRILDLYSFEFNGFDGWIDLQYSPSTPLDKKIRLGKIFSFESIDKAIMSLPKEEILQIDKLDGVLSFSLNNVIVERLREIYGENVVFVDNDKKFMIKEVE